MVSKGVHDYLKQENVPLVVAAVDYLLPIYREVNTYPYFVEEGIPGNPDGMATEELHGKALEILAPRFEKNGRVTVGRFLQLKGEGSKLVSDDIREIVTAARAGRVESLLMRPHRKAWGRFDAAKGTAELHEREAPGDSDLLDLASMHTFLNGGDVYALDVPVVPDGFSFGAIFRY
jgi:hypothetical protein